MPVTSQIVGGYQFYVREREGVADSDIEVSTWAASETSGGPHKA